MPGKISKAQIAAVTKYERNNYDKTTLRMPKGQLEPIRKAAEATGQSTNAYIMMAIENEMHGSHDSMMGSVQPCAVPGLDLEAEALEKAKEAAEAAGEPVPVFVARAIKDTAERDEFGRMLRR